MKNLFCDLEVTEDMTEEEITKAEKCSECAQRLLADLFRWQGIWEKQGINFNQIDSSAKADIGIIGKDAWLKIKREKIEGFKKEYEELVEKIRKSKENLKKKQA